MSRKNKILVVNLKIRVYILLLCRVKILFHKNIITIVIVCNAVVTAISQWVGSTRT